MRRRWGGGLCGDPCGLNMWGVKNNISGWDIDPCQCCCLGKESIKVCLEWG